MKKTDFLKAEIKSLQNSFRMQDKGTSNYEKAMKRIEFLKTCVLYLDTNPSEIFIKDTISNLNNQLVLIGARYQEWYNGNPNNRTLSDPKKHYEKLMNIRYIRQQIKTLNFLLEEF